MNLTNEEIEKRISDSYELPNRVVEKYPHPLVSIRTSTYNHGPYIKQCIEGVLIQKTNFPFEYIIGEDCSTDETRKIVFEYAKKYPDIIRVITADYNVGSKANGRRCIRACRGKYMAICEGDDYWTDPLKLQKQVDFLEDNSEYGMCYTKVQYYHQELQVLGKEWRGGYTSFEDLLKKNTIPTLSCLYRKSLYEKYALFVGPKIKDWKMGDYPMWLWFSHESKIAFLPIVTGVYRVLKNSASHSSKPVENIHFVLSTFDIKLYFAKRYNMDNQYSYYSFEKNWWLLLLAILEKDKKLIELYYDKLIQDSHFLRLKQRIVLLLCNLSIPLAYHLVKIYIDAYIGKR